MGGGLPPSLASRKPENPPRSMSPPQEHSRHDLPRIKRDPDEEEEEADEFHQNGLLQVPSPPENVRVKPEPVDDDMEVEVVSTPASTPLEKFKFKPKDNTFKAPTMVEGSAGGQRPLLGMGLAGAGGVKKGQGTPR